MIPKRKPGQTTGLGLLGAGKSKEAAKRLQSALKACGQDVPSAKTPGSTGKTGKSAPKTPQLGLKNAIAKFSACMQEHGASFPIQPGESITSPQYSAALKACYKALGSSPAVSPVG